MANRSQTLLCEAILEDHFGFYVKTVGHALLGNDLTLGELRRELKPTCQTRDIYRSIAIMDMHDLITSKLTVRGVLYSIVPDNVLRFVHLPRVIQTVNQLYGNICAMVMSELAFYGRASYEKCISSLLQAVPANDCQNAFFQLAEGQMIRKCDIVIPTETGFPAFQKDPQPFVFNVPVKVNEDVKGSRKRKLEDDNENVELWCINWQQIECYLRNELFLNVIKNQKDYSPNDELLWRSLLLVSDSRSNALGHQQSEPISVQEICSCMRKSYGSSISFEKANEILGKMSSENEFSKVSFKIIRKTGETAGGLYIINYAAAVEMFCNDHIESVLRQRIDDRAVRIFRLIRIHTHVEEEYLPKLAMLESKETKEICYMMLENGYIFTRPIARTNDFAPARSCYFYSYKLPELIANFTILCYDELRNVIFRRLHEVRANKILLDARQKIETIVGTINSDPEISPEDKLVQAEEVESQYMTDEDKRNFQRHLTSQRLLYATESGVGQALFVFQLGRLFEEQNSLIEANKKSTRRKKTSIFE
jgi:hypothetical protein